MYRYRYRVQAQVQARVQGDASCLYLGLRLSFYFERQQSKLIDEEILKKGNFSPRNTMNFEVVSIHGEVKHFTFTIQFTDVTATGQHACCS